MRFEMTKEEAEKILLFADEIEAYGIKFQGFTLGDGKYYGRKFLKDVCSKGGIVIDSEALTAEEHIIAVQNSGGIV